MLFVVKITALKFSPFFTGISDSCLDLYADLDLTGDLSLKKLSTNLNLLVTSFRLPRFVHFYGPSFLS